LKTEANSTGGSGSSAHTMSFVVAAAGCVVAIALLVGGFYRLNKRKEIERSLARNRSPL
jgi:membrane-associated phospholipid phosphatase